MLIIGKDSISSSNWLLKLSVKGLTRFGKIAGVARELEIKTGKPMTSKANFFAKRRFRE